MPQLLGHASRNMLLVDDALKTFHWGNIFTPNGQVLAFGALLSSRVETTPATEPFLRLKRDMVSALKHAGYAADLEPSTGQMNAVAHPGRSASIIVAGKEIGALFEVIPSVRERFGLPHRAAAVTINLDALLTIPPIERHAMLVPAYPAITYDVTMTLDRSKALQKILAKMRTSSPLLESVEVVDIYSGKPLQKDQYNVTVRCTYRSTERTLTEEEVKGEHDKVLGIQY
jgi:phenylalanyl-tRNA synthetase beta chain